MADISKFATNDVEDPLLYNMDRRGSKVCKNETKEGKIRLKTSPDREKELNCESTVLVHNYYRGSGANRSTGTDLCFCILDIKENKPILQKNPYHTTFAQNALNSSDVGPCD